MESSAGLVGLAKVRVRWRYHVFCRDTGHPDWAEHCVVPAGEVSMPDAMPVMTKVCKQNPLRKGAEKAGDSDAVTRTTKTTTATTTTTTKSQKKRKAVSAKPATKRPARKAKKAKKREKLTGRKRLVSWR
jgi:hypothetical protein